MEWVPLLLCFLLGACPAACLLLWARLPAVEKVYGL